MFYSCWECRGKYHTSGTCSNAEEKPEAGSGSPLEFEAANKACMDNSKKATGLTVEIAALRKELPKAMGAQAQLVEVCLPTLSCWCLDAHSSFTRVCGWWGLALWQKKIEALELAQAALRRCAHAAVLSFHMSGGLLRKRLEFDAGEVAASVNGVLALATSSSARSLVWSRLCCR
jgi:hypothetical protein